MDAAVGAAAAGPAAPFDRPPRSRRRRRRQRRQYGQIGGASASFSLLALLLACMLGLQGGAAHGVGNRRKLLNAFDPAALQWALDPAVRVTATPGTLKASGDDVRVCVSGLSEPRRSDDLIAAFAPADGPFNATAPIKLKYLNESSASPRQDGPPCVRFRLLNLRDAYALALIRGGPDAPVVAAVSAPVGFADPNEVTQVHLALTDKSGELRVTWITRDRRRPVVQWWPVDPSSQPAPSLRGPGGGEEEWRRQEAGAGSVTYTRADLCGEPGATIGYHDPGQIHSAVMTGLEGGRAYAYRVGDKELGLWSSETRFEAPRFFASSENGGDISYTFAVFGDMGTAEEDGSLDFGGEEVASLNTTKLLLAALDGPATCAGQHGLSLVVQIGDLSYAEGFDAQWDEYGDQIEPIARRVPWMVGIGNHERDSPTPSAFHDGRASLYKENDSGGECGVPTQLRFPMPGPWADAKKDETWYTFEAGPVHFVVMNFEKDFGPGSPQFDFVSKDLAENVDRVRTPWVVLLGHRPMYVLSYWDDGPAQPMSDSDQTVARLLQASLEDLLVVHRVDLALYGHHHSYQRTCQVYKNACLAPSDSPEYHAPVHAVVGMAGQGLSHNRPDVIPSIFEYADDSHFGLTLMTVNRTHLTITLRSAGGEGGGNGDVPLGAVLDSYTLTAKAPVASKPAGERSGRNGRRGMEVQIEEEML